MADDYDTSLFPDAYAVLANDPLLFPVEMGDWPAKIDSRHQLFVDDYLVKSIDGLTREYHKLRRHGANPLWTPSKRMAMLFYVMRDENSRFRIWYAQRVNVKNEDGQVRRHPTAFLESDDGIHWRAPSLGIVSADGTKDNNYVFRKSLEGIVYEPWEPDPSRRYKALAHLEPDNDRTPESREGYWLYVSPDGIHWTRDRDDPVGISLDRYGMPQTGVGDTSSWRWDPILKKYFCNAKFVFPGKYRAFGISESDDLIHWSRPRVQFYRDELDPEGMQFYAHHTFHYESMWFGLIKTMEIFGGELTRTGEAQWKHCELQLSLSRDGRNFTRSRDRTAFLPVPEDVNAMDMDYPAVATGSPIRMGNELWFYYSDRRHWQRKGSAPDPDDVDMRLFVATLRLDGFASLNAGAKPGRVTTRPLTFRKGGSLFINAEIGEDGYVTAEVRKAFPANTKRVYIPQNQREAVGSVVGHYALENCSPVTGNVFDAKITWGDKDTLECPDKSSLRLVFELKNARLYSFWVD